MQVHNLSLSKRDTGKKAKAQKTENEVYGVVYGHGLDSTSVKGDYQTVAKLISDAGTSQLIDLSIDESSPKKVLVKSLDLDPVSNKIRHFDLYAIKKGEKVDVDIPIELVGDAPALKVGLLVHQLIDVLNIRTVPDKIPESFEVDVSSLAEVNDSIYISDLKRDEDIEIDEDMLNQPIVKVDEPHYEEVEPAEEDVEAADVPSDHGEDESSEPEGSAGAEESTKEPSD